MCKIVAMSVLMLGFSAGVMADVTNNVDVIVEDGVTYSRRGSLGRDDYVATEVNALPANVDSLVSNEIFRSAVEQVSPPVISPDASASEGQAADAKATYDALQEANDAALLAVYYPEGNVTSLDQITTNWLTYTYNETNHTATLTDGKSATGDVVIPWKVVKDGVEYKVTAIGDGVFFVPSTYEGANITSVIVPTTVTGISGGSAFYNCSALTSVSLPSVTSIGINVFAGCTSLTSVSLPSATSIDNYAFDNCSSLTNVSLPFATFIGDSAFSGCTSLTSVSFPSATSIRNGVLSGCTSLTSVSLPFATSIGEGLFFNCSALTSIDFGATPRGTVPPLRGSFAFEGVSTTCKFIIPLGMYDEWIAADGWKNLYAQGYKFVGYADAAKAVSTGMVSNLVNEVKSNFYDEELQVNWTMKMVNGEMKLYATTNVNMSTL